MGSKRPKKDPLHRWIYGKVDRVLSISDETLRRNPFALPLPAERIQRLRLGTELTSCEEEPALIRGELGIPTGPLIRMVGRFSPGKGQRELPRVCPAACRIPRPSTAAGGDACHRGLMSPSSLSWSATLPSGKSVVSCIFRLPARYRPYVAGDGCGGDPFS